MKIKYSIDKNAKNNNVKLHIACLVENKMRKTSRINTAGAMTRVIKAHLKSKELRKIQHYSKSNTKIPYNIWVSDKDAYIPNIPNEDTLTVYNMEQTFDKEKFEKFLKQE